MLGPLERNFKKITKRHHSLRNFLILTVVVVILRDNIAHNLNTHSYRLDHSVEEVVGCKGP